MISYTSLKVWNLKLIFLVLIQIILAIKFAICVVPSSHTKIFNFITSKLILFWFSPTVSFKHNITSSNYIVYREFAPNKHIRKTCFNNHFYENVSGSMDSRNRFDQRIFIWKKKIIFTLLFHMYWILKLDFVCFNSEYSS